MPERDVLPDRLSTAERRKRGREAMLWLDNFDGAILSTRAAHAKDAFDRLRAENEGLRWALEEACNDAWTDGDAAAEQYMRRAESRPPN